MTKVAKKVIKVKVTDENVYHHIFTFLKPIVGLTTKEIEVVSQIIFKYQQSAGAEEEVRWKYTFSTESRKEIREALENNKEGNFNELISQLKKKDTPLGKVLMKNEEKNYWYINAGLLVVLSPGQSYNLILEFNNTDGEGRN